MQHHFQRLHLFIVVLHFAINNAIAQDANDLTFTKVSSYTSSVTAPSVDDATLHDIQFVGTKVGWAAGDRGVIWQSVDGGKSWNHVPAPVDCTLRSVCFLTDQIGWVAGGETIPYSQVGAGILLFTEDGGKTWQQLIGRSRPKTALPQKPQTQVRRLPQLHTVKFFGINQGVAVGATTPQHPVGVFFTEDGGHTWQEAEGEANAGWRTASFTGLNQGVVAGLRGKASLVGGLQLLQPRLGNLGLRGLHSVTVKADDTGWLVGDGGLILTTYNGGVVWEQPVTLLPEQLRAAIDFHAVVNHGNSVWCAGAPGSVIWHSPDGGKTWARQSTGQTAPIRSLTFSSETHGWAVGEFGMILKTEDGGTTWQAVRGDKRRAALLAFHTQPENISFHLLAKQARELGYRSVVSLASRPDLGPDQTIQADIDMQLGDAVVTAGGNAVEMGWELPLDIVGIRGNSAKLLEEWNRRTEGRFRDVFIGRLVRQIRTWRPSIVVIDQLDSEDAAGQLLKEAVIHAIRDAADPLRFIEQNELGRLGPWTVSRLYERVPDGSSGDVSIDPFELLPQCGESVSMAAAAARGCLGASPLPTSRSEAYRRIETQEVVTVAHSRGGDFFTGLNIPRGSEARREQPRINDFDLERRTILAHRQRNFRSYSQRAVGDPLQAAQLIAELNGLVTQMPESQAALQLAQLADDYRAYSRWDLVEDTMLELVRRYPSEPVAFDAMRWLLQFWCSQETAWQRSRAITARGQKVGADLRGTLEQIRQAQQRLGSETEDGRPVRIGDENRLAVATGGGSIQSGGKSDWRQGAVQNWERHALEMAAVIRQQAPEMYQTPGIEFPLAALVRRRKAYNVADEVYFRYQRNKAGDLWRTSARAEIWMNRPLGEAPKTMILCRRTATPPLLDGLLSDPCWVDAPELRLTASAESQVETGDNDVPFVMLAHDGRFLYVAASFPRHAEMPTTPVEFEGRTHDADLSGYDRISLFLDVDRDYATWYTLEVDQRGWTTDACWQDAAWDPKWYVAADGDRTHWRIEAAIPIGELTPELPGLNTVWGLGLVRTMPAVGQQSWTHPHGSEPRPESFGLVKFQ